MLLSFARVAPAKSHGAIGVGTFTEVTEPAFGGWAGFELWPRGLWGVRLDAFALDFTEGALLEASVGRILGQARPHLVMHAHVGGGYAHPSGIVTVAGGLATQLGLKLGPLALGADATLHFGFGDDSGGPVDLFVTGVLALKAAW